VLSAAHARAAVVWCFCGAGLLACGTTSDGGDPFATPDAGQTSSDGVSGTDETNEPSGCTSDDVCVVELADALAACQAARCGDDGVCFAVVAEDGASCDDQAPCTQDDVCAAGVCAGVARSCDDSNPCTQDSCDPKEGDDPCVYVVLEGGCDDGDYCTVDDACVDGACEGAVTDCSGLNRDCVEGVCDPSNGACISAVFEDGAACDDGEACTSGDQCVAGACVAEPVTCTEMDTPCASYGCEAETGQCVVKATYDEVACDDGDDCTDFDQCSAGVCVSGETLNCSQLDDGCNLGVCVAGACAAQVLPVGTSCEDGDPCTKGDICAQGACLSGELEVCDDGSACNGLEVCDGATGECVQGEAKVCDDGNPCNGVESCDGVTGGCTSTAPIVCDDSDPCNGFESCDSVTGACVPGDSIVCDDGNPCDGLETCEVGTGACLPGEPPPCNDDDPCNGVESCDIATGDCIAGDVVVCDDALPCNGVETCDAATGACLAGELVSCDDGDACNGLEACDATTGECYSGAAPACDDGDLCNGAEGCDPETGACLPGTPSDCDDDDLCNGVESCDADTGGCLAGESVVCDDGQACNGLETCHAATGGCMSGSALVCDDLAPCNGIEACDNAAGGCVAGEPVDCQDDDPCDGVTECAAESGNCVTGPAPVCSDDEPCNGQEICDAASGGCVPGAELDCDDGLACTDDACVPNVGCEHVLNPGCQCATIADCAPFQTEGLCDGSLDCLDGVCAVDPLTVVPCDTSGDAACENTGCDLETGTCETLPDTGTPCGDGDLCTVQDACLEGVCVGMSKDCSFLDDACTSGVCQPQDGACIADVTDNGQACEDGDPCTVEQTCESGACVGGSGLNCTAFESACATGECLASFGGCYGSPINEGAGCDDGDICTLGDLCGAGVCSGEAKECDLTDEDCATTGCDADTGECVLIPFDEADECDDDDLCTGQDTCDEGVCVGTPVDCQGDAEACEVATCDSVTGCSVTSAADGTACDDSDGCTTESTCDDGECLGAPVDCGDVEVGPCEVVACDPGWGSCVVTFAPDETPCDDGDGCTSNAQCFGGACVGEPVVCSGSPDTCALNTCDPATGACVAVSVAEGEPCDDGDLCTEDALCQGGSCVGETLDCGGSTSCASASCDPESGGCVLNSYSDGTPCDDTNLCTSGDLCEAGQCIGEEIICGGDDVCTLLSCDESTGGCSVTAPQPDGSPCGEAEGGPCEGQAHCQSGACEQGVPMDCGEPSAPCLVIACDDTIGGCVEGPAAEGSTCDDGDPCTTNDSCGSGVCTGQDVPQCGEVPVLCQASGADGSYGYCEVHVARRCAEVSSSGTLQFYFSWDPSQVQLVYFTDGGQDPTITPPFTDPLYQTYPAYMGSFGAPGYYPTCTEHPSVPGFCLDYAHQYNTGPGTGSDDWPGNMTIFVYTDGAPQPIVDGVLDEGGDTLVFHLHYKLVSEVDEGAPTPIQMTEVVADDLDTAPMAPALEDGVVVLDTSPTVCP
jgi:hypothetical protein